MTHLDAIRELKELFPQQDFYLHCQWAWEDGQLKQSWNLWLPLKTGKLHQIEKKTIEEVVQTARKLKK